MNLEEEMLVQVKVTHLEDIPDELGCEWESPTSI